VAPGQAREQGEEKRPPQRAAESPSVGALRHEPLIICEKREPMRKKQTLFIAAVDHRTPRYHLEKQEHVN